MNPPSLLVNRTSSPAVIASLHSLSRKSNSVRRTIKAALALLGLLVFLTSNAGYSYAQQAGQLEMWVSNWRVQVFNDTRRPGIARSAIQLVTARNEYESAQIVLRSTSAFTIQSVVASNLVSGTKTLDRSNFRYNFVDYVYAGKNSGGQGYCDEAMVDPVRRAPGSFPEQLSNDTRRTVAANVTQPIWVKFRIPTNAGVGTYSGTVTVNTSLGQIQVPVTIEVNQATLPDPKDGTFSSEFWIYPHTITQVFGYPALSEKWWSIVDDFAALMRESRMNVPMVWTQYLYSRTDSWDAYDQYVQHFINTGGVKKITTETMGSAATEYAAMLESHLRQKGWFDMFYMKIMDEPTDTAAYVNLAKAVKRISPAMKIGDPGITNPAGYGYAVDVWQPHITYQGGYDKYAPHFSEIKKRPGAEVWVYTACFPTQGQINVHIDDRVFETELFGWYTYARNLRGFLFWGLANWEQYPDYPYYQSVGSLGDAWMVYPDAANGTIMSSIRVEAAREMAEDHELFRLLEKVNPSLSRGIVNSVIRSPGDFEKNPDVIQQKRNQLVRQRAS